MSLEVDPPPVALPRSDGALFDRPIVIVAVAVAAALVKTSIALSTMGTNDVVAFYQFAKALEAHGLSWTYEHSILFNHPPLVGYFLRGIGWLDQQPFCRQTGLTFPFLLRFPSIVADFILTLLVLSVVREYPELRPPRWTVLLFAASPVSIMVSGFHGNTDAMMVLFLFLGALMAVRGRPALCGLCIALSCQVKIIPLLLLPVFIFFWTARRRSLPFAATFVLASVLFSIEPLLQSPTALLKNVLSYGSFWGIWGLTSLLRMTGLAQFDKTSFFSLSPAQNAIMLALKILVASGIVLLAWRRRNLPTPALFATLGYAWMIFFVLSPAVAAQYLVWLAPFILLLAPMFYGFLVAGCSLFLFALYTITSGGFPWYFAHASNKLNSVTAHWALVPWLTLVGGAGVMLWNVRRQRVVFDAKMQESPAHGT